MSVCVRAPLSPPLAGDHAHLLPLPQMPGLPPLLVGGVDHVEDVSEAEVQALAGQPRVSALVVVKKSSATQAAAAAESRARAQDWSCWGPGGAYLT